MSDYATLTVKVSKEDIKSFLSNFYDEEDLEDMDVEDKAVDCVEGILSDHFSDYYVFDKNCIVLGEF